MANRQRSSSPKVIDTPRQSLPLPIGAGLYPVGDLAKAPPGTAARIKNCFVRPGPRLEKRSGWARETGLPGTTNATARLFRSELLFGFGVSEPITSLLMMGSGSGGALTDYGASYTLGAWTARTAFSVYTADCCILNNILYGSVPNYVSGSSSTDRPHLWSFSGNSVNNDAGATGLGGASVCSYNHRIFMGNITEMPDNKAETTNAHLKFEDNTVWTLGGGPPTVASSSGVRTLTIVGSTDTVKTTAAVYTSGASEEYVMVQPFFRASSATVDMPFTITVEDSTGANVYGSLEILVVNRTIVSGWQRFTFPNGGTRIPASTAVYIKIKPGTTTVSAVAGSVDVSDSTGGYYWYFTKGRRVWTNRNLTSGASSVTPQIDRFVWCEVDAPTDWRATSYYDCREVAGSITAVRSSSGMLHVFKKNAIWSFVSQDNAALPIQFKNLLHNVGCVHRQAITQFEDITYFASDREVHAWDSTGAPQPIAGAAMRELLFNASTVANPILQVHESDRQLWCYLQPGKVYTYDIDAKVWSGPITFTGVDDAELNITDMVYIKPNGESVAEMWVTMASSADVVKLRSSQTQDNITGTARDVTAEYWFRPIQTLEPKQSIILESLEVDHKVTSSQSGSTTTAEISYDGGTTFANAVNVTLAPLAGGDYQPMRLDLWESNDRMLVAIKHTGLAGPTYFNMSGASAMVQICGDRIQTTNPTTTSSTL